jgi:hypothetical protein
MKMATVIGSKEDLRLLKSLDPNLLKAAGIDVESLEKSDAPGLDLEKAEEAMFGVSGLSKTDLLVLKGLDADLVKSAGINMEALMKGDRWVTITNESSPLHGRHILIDGDGNIKGGRIPKEMRGKHISKIGKNSGTASDKKTETKAPVKEVATAPKEAPTGKSGGGTYEQLADRAEHIANTIAKEDSHGMAGMGRLKELREELSKVQSKMLELKHQKEAKATAKPEAKKEAPKAKEKAKPPISADDYDDDANDPNVIKETVAEHVKKQEATKAKAEAAKAPTAKAKAETKPKQEAKGKSKTKIDIPAVLKEINEAWVNKKLKEKGFDGAISASVYQGLNGIKAMVKMPDGRSGNVLLEEKKSDKVIGNSSTAPHASHSNMTDTGKKKPKAPKAIEDKLDKMEDRRWYLEERLSDAKFEHAHSQAWDYQHSIDQLDEEMKKIRDKYSFE